MAIDRQLESETIIRWDETGEPAKLWTACAPIAREWRSFGFPVVQWAMGGWYAEVPVDRIAYRTMKKTAEGSVVTLDASPAANPKIGRKNTGTFEPKS